MQVKHYGHRRQGSLIAKGPVKTDGRVGTRDAGKAEQHQNDALTLLSAVETAKTSELAGAIGISTPYMSTLLVRLELEGKIEKVGRGEWTLP